MKSYCPITLDLLKEDESHYSKKGLQTLSRTLKDLTPLQYTTDQQMAEAVARADKMSIQGVQPKLSALLKVNEGKFEIVDTGGRFILKPCPTMFQEVPANESLTMTMADLCGIETPDHGLVYAVDQSFTYWIKRFDRKGRSNRKFPQEDFAQLTGRSRETKYDSSMEKVVSVLEQYCTFPVLEKRKIATLTLFCYLTGNEDMHLKNFSIITREQNGQPMIKLSPAYDLLNTTIVLKNPPEEVALPIKGKKRNLSRTDLLKYFCIERCGLSSKYLDKILEELSGHLPMMRSLIERSFLSDNLRVAYTDILNQRAEKLGL